MSESYRSEISLRRASEADVGLLLRLIRELAAYEKLDHEVVADEALLRVSLFGPRPAAEVIIAEQHSETAGFALFFHNFSTFLGRPGIYLEDLFVRPRFRGQGVGKALLAYLAHLAVDRSCGRLEWSVLDWNESAIRFYRSLGARPMQDWTVFRVDGGGLERLATSGPNSPLTD